MYGTIDGFNYGATTPLAAYLMACLGGALGLRCTARSVRTQRSWKPGWLALGSASIGSGIWTMHFIAMMGFHVKETPVGFDIPITLLSLLVAIVVVGIGVFMVGYRGVSRRVLLSAGVFTGLGVAGMHYIGMSAMRMQGHLEYSVPTVLLSVLIAVVAATAALWAAVTIHGFRASLGSSMVMGVAVTGMHYTGMAAVSVRLDDVLDASVGGNAPASLILPMLIGPVIFLVVAGTIIMFDPLLVLGEGEWNEKKADSSRLPPPPPPRPVWPARPPEDPVQAPASRPAPPHSGQEYGGW
ncbi:MHYT domain-containing protein [Streptomyces violaceusniger]|uniref:Integral membrane sensor protein n=1 Tax=Streptomyces violaceusniger (strain Tu 4113) TaxID=653045 RepID=G2NUR4_STRV4|nr:MHYT domain-containing protein [Streptomyces violaceusniger]AEM84880.1 putative integral membrane sensor protein [Streptomyces violaceusniger Tu 4113]